jgi:hypothetical protein
VDAERHGDRRIDGRYLLERDEVRQRVDTEAVNSSGIIMPRNLAR